MIELSHNKIRYAIAQRQLTIEDVAKKYGCSRQRMGLIVNSSYVQEKTAGKLAAAIGCNVSELVKPE